MAVFRNEGNTISNDRFGLNSMSDRINKVKECIHDSVLYFIDWILAPTLNTSPDSFLYNKNKDIH